ncbi:unnamed protein product, partial [Prorocentrum cordatum]
ACAAFGARVARVPREGGRAPPLPDLTAVQCGAAAGAEPARAPPRRREARPPRGAAVPAGAKARQSRSARGGPVGAEAMLRLRQDILSGAAARPRGEPAEAPAPAAAALAQAEARGGGGSARLQHGGNPIWRAVQVEFAILAMTLAVPAIAHLSSARQREKRPRPVERPREGR